MYLRRSDGTSFWLPLKYCPYLCNIIKSALQCVEFKQVLEKIIPRYFQFNSSITNIERRKPNYCIQKPTNWQNVMSFLLLNHLLIHVMHWILTQTILQINIPSRKTQIHYSLPDEDDRIPLQNIQLNVKYKMKLIRVNDQTSCDH